MGESTTAKFPPLEAMRVRRWTDDLFAGPAVAQNLVACAERGARPEAPAFERYAAIVLRDAGVRELANVPPAHAPKIIPPTGGRLVQLQDVETHGGHSPATERAGEPAGGRQAERAGEPAGGQATLPPARLRTIEDALNRLASMANALEDGANTAKAHATQSFFISYLGVDRPPLQPAKGAAFVELPPIEPTQKPTVAYYNELDWRVLDHAAGAAHALFPASLRPNMRQGVLGAYAPAGSDWDIRTRIAALLQNLGLPMRLTCSFDCDAENQAAYVQFTCPEADSLPQWAADGHGALRRLGSDELLRAHAALAVRIACLVASALFGSSRRMGQAHVRALDPQGATVLECAFEREAFVRTFLVALDSGAFASALWRFDPAGLIDLAAPAWAHLHIAAPLQGPIESPARANPPSPALTCGNRPRVFMENPQRTDPQADERPLDAQLARLFGAKRVCDMDTRGYFGGGSDLIEAAKADAADAPIAAIAQLESAVRTFEAQTHPPDDDANARPLYCGNAFARIAVPLACAELSIADQAEAYLMEMLAESHAPNAWAHRKQASDAQMSNARADNAQSANAQSANAQLELPSFFRAPSALFHAHMGLSDLHERIGDFAGAATHADRCIALAPTTAAAYLRKADVLAQQTLYSQAANVLIAGLRCAISKRDCALLYYHLGLVMWRLGRKEDAVAIQVYASALRGEFAEKARAVVVNLKKQRESPVIVHAAPLAAARELARARIPVVPGDEARTLIACAALGLTCSNAPNAAAPYAKALADALPGDPIIATACHSIIACGT